MFRCLRKIMYVLSNCFKCLVIRFFLFLPKCKKRKCSCSLLKQRVYLPFEVTAFYFKFTITSWQISSVLGTNFGLCTNRIVGCDKYSKFCEEDLHRGPLTPICQQTFQLHQVEHQALTNIHRLILTLERRERLVVFFYFCFFYLLGVLTSCTTFKHS